MRRQDVPPSAFYRGRLEIRAVVAVSYPWLSAQHPDEDGWHLAILGRLLSLFCDLYGDAAVFLEYRPPPKPGPPPAPCDPLLLSWPLF